MATKTLGTSATTSLTAIPWTSGSNAQADIATIAAGIYSDGNVTPGVGQWSNSPFASKANGGPSWPGALEMLGAEGQLIIPNRGILKVLPGDYVAFDATTGWPILLSALAIASGPWTHS